MNCHPSSQLQTDVAASMLKQLDQLILPLRELLKEAKELTKAKVIFDGRISPDLMDDQQHRIHGLAWFATYVETISQYGAYLNALQSEDQLGETEVLMAQIGVHMYLSHIVGGIPMNQSEFITLRELGISNEKYIIFLSSEVVQHILNEWNDLNSRSRLIELLNARMGSSIFGASGLDETLEAIREEMARFCAKDVASFAHEWHLNNEYIPMDVVEQMSELGVFGLTIDEDYGGLGLGKESMCVVSEELSRGYIGVGSLGTRSEIAAELILCGGTKEQKEKWLPKIADGSILPTAVFTEPNTGSDLAHLKTRAVKDGNVYRITGQKTWITHPVRADVMTVLARTNPDEKGYKGLSMFLVEKPRGDDDTPFPVEGMSGGEIEVIGYRGMKEYDISFDNLEVPAENLLGGVEGQGFKQLMQTFEAARIQTAARAIGVAQAAMDVGLKYATERIQFGRPIVHFPRVYNKLINIAAEISLVRQLTYFAAREKDNDRRCDVEAGMAKLIAARCAWSAADNALQIHGGNGFAMEYPVSRLLADARILNIFEGAGEIQAQVIARRLLES